MKFYHCDICNRDMFLTDSETKVPNCCGKPMTLLQPKTTIDDKHTPVVTINGNKLTVNVGKVAHPNEPTHKILWICIETNKDYLFRDLLDGPSYTFTLAPEQKPLKAYALCNVHGLYVTDIK